MKKILLASTALIASAGFAAAEVVVGGDGYFGAALSTYDGDGFFETRNNEASTYVFVYDLDIDFTATGTSDSGLTFGASVDLDDAASNTASKQSVIKADANGNPIPVYDAAGNFTGYETTNAVTGLSNNTQGPLGYEGELFVSGDFGTLTMGDVDGATEQVVGDLAGVGLTGLGDLNEMIYLVDGNAQPDGSPLALYEYTVEGLTLGLGVTDDKSWNVGAGYETDMFSVGIGYESVKDGAAVTIYQPGTFAPTVNSQGNVVLGSSGVGGLAINTPDDAHQTIGQASVTFAGVTLKGAYGLIDLENAGDIAQYGISASYGMDAITLSGFWRGTEFDFDNSNINDQTNNFFGLGLAYDLGGGLAIETGVVQADYDFLDSNVVIADFGLSFNF